MRTRDMKARAEELLDGYEDAYNEAFSEEFQDFLTDSGYPKNVITEDDLQGFMDSFTFPDEGEWAFQKVQSELDDVADQKYQLMKDEGLLNG